MAKVYLAGPDVFLPSAVAMGRDKVLRCARHGLEGLFPLDNEIEGAGNPHAIFAANAALMQSADAGLFNLTPFRGQSADVGTVFELGYMHALGRPIFAYTADPCPFADRVARAGAVEGRPVDADGFWIEDFGLADNLMIEGALKAAGGALFAKAPAPGATPAETLAAVDAFELALDAVAARLETTD